MPRTAQAHHRIVETTGAHDLEAQDMEGAGVMEGAMIASGEGGQVCQGLDPPHLWGGSIDRHQQHPWVEEGAA